MGDFDFDKNLCLCLVVKVVKLQLMLKDVIECVIKKLQVGDGDEYIEICYEGYGLSGIVVIVEVLIDNVNWMVLNVWLIFFKYGGNFGIIGLVFFSFDCVGEIIYLVDVGDVDIVMMVVLEVGVEDVELEEDGYWIYCVMEDFVEVFDVLEKEFGEVKDIKLIWKL